MIRGLLNPWMWNSRYRGTTSVWRADYKFYTGFRLHRGWVPLTPTLFKGQLYFIPFSPVVYCIFPSGGLDSASYLSWVSIWPLQHSPNSCSTVARGIQEVSLALLVPQFVWRYVPLLLAELVGEIPLGSPGERCKIWKPSLRRPCSLWMSNLLIEEGD